jgi:hypothetical protein
MNLAAGITLAGDVILAVTLLVFITQARSMTRSTRASVYQTVAQQMMSIDQLFVERPELRPYFYGNKPPPTEEIERERVAAFAELFVDFMDNLVGQTPHIPEHLGESWRAYFRAVASTSPAIREFWRAHRDWYEEHMWQVLDSACLIEEQVVPLPVAQKSGD